MDHENGLNIIPPKESLCLLSFSSSSISISISLDDNSRKTFNALTMDFMAVSMCKIFEGLLKEY